MKAQRNSENIEYVQGFRTEWLISLPIQLSVRQLMVLNHTVRLFNLDKLHYRYFDGQRHTWISYSILLRTFDGLKFNKRQLKREVKVLIDNNIITSELVNTAVGYRLYLGLPESTRIGCLYDIKS